MPFFEENGISQSTLDTAVDGAVSNLVGQDIKMEYTSATTLTIGTGTAVYSDDGTTFMDFSGGAQVVDITATGANGLMTGLTEASDTWYYVWAISNGTDMRGILTTSFTTVATLPSGYTYTA